MKGHSHHTQHPQDQRDRRLSRNLGKYKCPMHPEVISDQPGDCPKCGMRLELIPTLAPRKGTIYTCPMHPQVQQDHPGECPICGMSLEPKTVDVEDEGEIKSLSLKFWIGLALINVDVHKIDFLQYHSSFHRNVWVPVNYLFALWLVADTFFEIRLDVPRCGTSLVHDPWIQRRSSLQPDPHPK